MKIAPAAYCILLLLICQSTCSDTVFKTHWQLTQLPGKPALRGSAVFNNTLWVTGSDNSVFISTNSGLSWRDVSIENGIDGDLRDIEVLDDNTAIAMSVGTGKQSRLYITTDQGKHWKVLYENPHKQGFFNSIDFWDKNNGLLFGDPVDGYFVIMRTRDGGKSWQRIDQSNIPPVRSQEAAFAASGNTLIIGNDAQAWFTTGGLSASVYSSGDNGSSWQRQSTGLYSATPTSGGYALALNQQQQLFVMGGDYRARHRTYPNLARLTDKRWSTVDNGHRGLRTAMACNTQCCIASGLLSTDISFDHGKSWQPLRYQQQSNAAVDIGFYTMASDNSLFLGAGADGQVATLTISH